MTMCGPFSTRRNNNTVQLAHALETIGGHNFAWTSEPLWLGFMTNLRARKSRDVVSLKPTKER